MMEDRLSLRTRRDALMTKGLAWVGTARRFQRWINIVGVIGGGTLAVIGGGMEGPMVPVTGEGVLTVKGATIVLGGMLVAVASLILLHLQDEGPALLASASELEREAQKFLDERDALKRDVQDCLERDERRLALIDANRTMREALEQFLLDADAKVPETVEGMLDAAGRFINRSIGFEQGEAWVISVFQVQGDQLVRVASRRANRLDEKPDGRSWKQNEGFVGVAWAQKRDVIIHDGTLQDIVADYPVPHEKARDYDAVRYRSLAAIPVRLGDPAEIWGVIAASTDRADRFRRDPDNRQVQSVDTVRLIARMTALMAAAFRRSKT